MKVELGTKCTVDKYLACTLLQIALIEELGVFYILQRHCNSRNLYLVAAAAIATLHGLAEWGPCV